MAEIGRIAFGKALQDRIDGLESEVKELTRILDTLLYELEEGTDPRKAAMIARDHLESQEIELEPTGTE
jgi:hypothetical protein